MAVNRIGQVLLELSDCESGVLRPPIDGLCQGLNLRYHGIECVVGVLDKHA